MLCPSHHHVISIDGGDGRWWKGSQLEASEQLDVDNEHTRTRTLIV